MTTDAFFAYARERHSIYLRRASGSPGPWTDDTILQTFRFCNVYRELDTTTIKMRQITDRMRAQPQVLLAVVIARWFNRIETMQAIFDQQHIEGGSAFDRICRMRTGSDPRPALKTAIIGLCGKGPYVTGSYIVKTLDGVNKLDGVLWAIREFMSRTCKIPDGQGVAGWGTASILGLEFAQQGSPFSLEEMWRWLRTFPYLGDFMAYEVVTDLRHTALCEGSRDIMTWANPGPGAMRGLNRIYERPLESRVTKEQANHEMRLLLDVSRCRSQWPTDSVVTQSPLWVAEWPRWEMREVEHTLCEFDKYERTRLGQGSPRQRFRGGAR